MSLRIRVWSGGVHVEQGARDPTGRDEDGHVRALERHPAEHRVGQDPAGVLVPRDEVDVPAGGDPHRVYRIMVTQPREQLGGVEAGHALEREGRQVAFGEVGCWHGAAPRIRRGRFADQDSPCRSTAP
jgi:hypothetical protein